MEYRFDDILQKTGISRNLDELEKMRIEAIPIKKQFDAHMKSRRGCAQSGCLMFVLLVAGLIALFYFLNMRDNNPERFNSMSQYLTYVKMFFIAAFSLIFLLGIKSRFTNKKSREDKFRYVKENLDNYSHHYKTMVIPDLIKGIDPSIFYAPMGFIPFKEAAESNFPGFLKRQGNYGIFDPHSFRGEDFIKGKIGKTDFEMCEIFSYSEQFHSKTFNHVLFIADFHKNFTTGIKVYNRSFLTKIPQIGDEGMKRIKLEMPEFNEAFVVRGFDQVEARYILSLSLMKRLADFRNKNLKTGINISSYYSSLAMSFKESRLYILVGAHNRNYFDPSFSEKVSNVEQLKHIYEDIHTFISIVEDLNLNTRIWSKE
jgi:hypothetical protein